MNHQSALKYFLIALKFSDDEEVDRCMVDMEDKKLYTLDWWRKRGCEVFHDFETCEENVSMTSSFSFISKVLLLEEDSLPQREHA